MADTEKPGDINPVVTSAWDITTDPANPKPNIWPECSTCETAYVYQRVMSLSKGWVWTWVRGCRHKSQPVLVTDDGPYEPSSNREEAAE